MRRRLQTTAAWKASRRAPQAEGRAGQLICRRVPWRLHCVLQPALRPNMFSASCNPLAIPDLLPGFTDGCALHPRQPDVHSRCGGIEGAGWGPPALCWWFLLARLLSMAHGAARREP